MTQPLPFDPIAEAHRQWVDHGWEDAADGMAVVTSLARAHQLMLGRVEEALRPFELSFARYELLMLLHFSRSGTLPLATVGSRLQVHPTSVTSAVVRLEQQGLVRRVPHPHDRRAKLAELTPDGRDRVLRATQVLNATVFAAPGVPPDDGARLVEVLTALRRDAGDF